MAGPVELAPVDAVDVTVLVDNAIDILAAPTDVARRPPSAWEWSQEPQLRAEHGYALLVTVMYEGKRSTVLYDAGLGRDTVTHNLDVLSLSPKDVQATVLSHSHPDHLAGLEGIYRRAGRAGMPLVVHPEIWRDRRIVFPSGVQVHLPPPSRQDLDREGWSVIEERRHSLLLDGCLLVTGEVARTTSYERGMPIHQMRNGDAWVPDPLIPDDQAVVVNVRDRGLVILSSCSHSGAINVLRHARALTGVDRVLAFVGGMHLTGGLFEPIISQTVNDLAVIAPTFVVPGHCTGWRAQLAIANKLPDAYVPSNVGTTLHFAAS